MTDRGVNVEVLDDAEALARRAADLIEGVVREKPTLSLLVATGNTPLATYTELTRRNLDASAVTAVQLDEYLGVGEDDPRSLWGWMRRAFVEPLGVRKVIRLDATAPDPVEACRRFELEVAALGGIDLALLGLGPNGHLGFNEPPCLPDAGTRPVTLTPESLASNAAYWDGLAVPTGALTAGMDLILGARQTLLLVSGAHKRGILARTLQESPTPEVPASWLRGTNTTVLADRAAWGGL
ncbi:glucosamine-6-phosphate deaminase [Deinococcus sp. YIM 134068]|uniref:glucosamine-6-phosphate deaminase n=1 Tax=Deinococcus lichenicola TaxID=3118910 RepID=UPI002F94F258